MADTQSNIQVSIDTTQALASIKNLQRQISAFHSSMAKSGAAANAVSAQMQQTLLNSINATGKFSAEIRSIRTTTESFTNSLEKNKFSLGEYFRYAGGASKTFGRLFKTEFDTINKVARENVKDLQTQYIRLGRDASGAMKSIAVRPLALDMSDLGTRTQIAAQKQVILNQLLKQGSTNLLNFGKNTQWAGRQLMVGFTLPLITIGSAAAKTFMEMETQAIRFKKVYGDLFTTTSESQVALKDIQELGKEFTKYGIAVSTTVGLAAEAAAAGFQGVDLQRQTAAATKLSILGQVESQKALETTIALQNAFSMSSADLATNIDFLNAVENQTVLSLDDISTAIPKAAPIVQQLGGDVKDLAFFMTAMKEGGINASEGANALKSGLASLINPTGKANDMLLSFGINAKNIVESNKGDLKKTVIEFASALNQLDPLNRAQAIEQMFGKFQFSRLSTLFANVTKDGTQASRVLDLAGSSIQELAALSEKELGMTSESAMNKFKASVENLKLSLVPVGEEFLKAVTPIAQFVTKMLDGFNNLGDGTKKFIVTITGVVAGLGPVLLMTFGLLANGLANIIKGFTLLKTIFNKAGQSSATLGTEVQYMTLEQRNAAAVAASLDQVHRNLAQTFTSEAAAVDALTAAYTRAIAKQAQFGGAGIVTRTKASKFAKGRPYVVGGTGNKDSEPAMLMPGETVLPTAMSKKYAGLINGIIADNIPGYSQGKGSVKGTLFGYEGSFSRRSSVAAIASRFEGLDAAVQSELAGVIPDIMGSLQGTSISLQTFSDEIKKRIDSGLLEIKKSEMGGFGEDKASAAPTALAKRKAKMAAWDTRQEELAAKEALAAQYDLTDTQKAEVGLTQGQAPMRGTSIAHLEPKTRGEAKSWATRSAQGVARLQAEDTAINAYLNDLSNITEDYKKTTGDFIGSITTAAERESDIASRLLSGQQPRTRREYDILSQVAERDAATRGTPESITGLKKKSKYRAAFAGSAAKIRTKSRTYFTASGAINPEYQDFDPKKSAKAAEDRGKKDADSYEKGKKKAKIKDPYETSTESSRKSPHPKAARDGRDDARAYSDASEKEFSKRRRRSASRAQGPASIGASALPGATMLPIVAPLTAAEKRKNKKQKRKARLLSRTKAVGSKLGTRLGGGTALLGANMALSTMPDFAGKGIIQSTMTGAMLGTLFGPYGAAAGAAIGLVTSALGALIEKQKQYKAMTEAMFKSSTDIATFFGNTVVNTDIAIGRMNSSLGIAGDNASNLGKSFGYSNEELQRFIDLVNSLPENNPLKNIVDGLTDEKNPEKILEIAKAFVTTQVAIGQIKPDQAQKTLDLILAASGKAAMVGSSFINLSTQVNAISVSLNNAKNNSVGLGTTLTQLVGAAANSSSLEQMRVYIDGIAQSGITAASALSSMYYAYLQVGNLGAADTVQVLKKINGVTKEQAALILAAAAKGFKQEVSIATTGKELAAQAEDYLRKMDVKSKQQEKISNRPYMAQEKSVDGLKTEIKLLKAKKKIIDDQIKQEKKITDELKKQNDYKDKQRELDSQIVDAKIKGNYIEAASLLQQKEQNTAEYRQEKALSAKQEASDALQDQIDALQANSDAVVSSVNKVTSAVNNSATNIVAAIGGLQLQTTNDGSGKSKAALLSTTPTDVQGYLDAYKPKSTYTPGAQGGGSGGGVLQQSDIDAAKAWDNKESRDRFEAYARTFFSGALAGLKEGVEGIIIQAEGKDGKTYKFNLKKNGDFIRVSKNKDGGSIKGPGTGTSDSIPAYLSNGEYVIKSDSVKKYGVGTFDALNAQRFKDGGGVFSKIMNSVTSPLGTVGTGMGFGLNMLSKIDQYRKNKDLNKWVKTSGDGAEWMQKATKNPNAQTIYVYDMANKFESKDRTPIVNQALEYLTGQTGVQFKRATFGMRNDPKVVKLDWASLANGEKNTDTSGTSVPGSRYVNLISPRGLNLGSFERRGGQNIIAHEILHSLNIGNYNQESGKPYNDSSFFGHAKNPFNVMFPFVGGTIPQFISKSDTESLRYMADFYNFDSKLIKKATGGLIKGSGTGTSDSIRATLGYAGGGSIRVSNGEFVVRASSVKDYGLAKMNAINNGTADVNAGSGTTVYNINMPITSNGSDPKVVGDYVIKQLKLVVDKNNKGNKVTP